MDKSLLNTKVIVPRQDVRAVEKLMFKKGFGYPLSLGLSDLPRYKSGAKHCVAFIINYNGEMKDLNYDKDYTEFDRAFEEEVNWEYFFN